MDKRIKTRKIVLLSLLTAGAIILHMVESMLPNPMLVISPGARLGLSNIVTLGILYIYGAKEALIVMLVRVFLGGILYGSPITIIYALFGGLLSLAVMILLKKSKGVSIKGVSMTGAVFHNIGQLIVASVLISNIRIMYYLPIMLISSLGTGLFVGLGGEFLSLRIKAIHKS